MRCYTKHDGLCTNNDGDFVLKSMDYVTKMMDFVLKMMDYVPNTMASIDELEDSVKAAVQMSNFDLAKQLREAQENARQAKLDLSGGGGMGLFQPKGCVLMLFCSILCCFVLFSYCFILFHTVLYCFAGGTWAGTLRPVPQGCELGVKWAEG